MVFEEILNICLDCYDKMDYKKMLQYSTVAKKMNPYNLMANYLSAVANSFYGNWADSYADLRYLERLQTIYQQEVVAPEELTEMIHQIKEKALSGNIMETGEKKQYNNRELINQIDERYNLLEDNLFCSFDLKENYFRGLEIDRKSYYMGGYFSMASSYLSESSYSNCLLDKVDIFEIDAISSKRTYSNQLPCIVPIVANISKDKYINHLQIETENNNYSISRAGCKNYNYYRVDKRTTITAKDPMIFGKPIPLRHDKKRKKLVLSIFLDSFNWKFVKERSLQECMPNTYDFFKNGVICNEYYVGSEFTYPSIATYWTGLRSSHHKVLNYAVKNPIPIETPLLSEIFRDAGYFTAKIGGNDSVSPEFGYLRGIDRFLYQFWQSGFSVHEAVHEVIEHMEAFRETDQFIWLDIPDLHDVAGMWDMPLSVQAECPLGVNEIDFTAKYPGTLYMTPSTNRREVYLREMKYIDRQLGILYQYILQHYKKDEVVVAFFSDHGNGFNVNADQPFLSWQRENVPLMIYGSDFATNYCSELIESVDYGHILCHLAGIEDDRLKNNDGKLPAFFGGEEKEYVFAQSHHPDREYCAFVGTKEYRFYLESKKRVDKDCRVELSAGVTIILVDSNDKRIYNEEIIEKCKTIVLENIQDFAY